MNAFVEFITANIGTIAVLLALAFVLALIAFKMIRDKKKGKSSCGCGCSTCPMSEKCHEKAEKK